MTCTNPDPLITLTTLGGEEIILMITNIVSISSNKKGVKATYTQGSKVVVVTGETYLVQQTPLEVANSVRVKSRSERIAMSY